MRHFSRTRFPLILLLLICASAFGCASTAPALRADASADTNQVNRAATVRPQNTSPGEGAASTTAYRVKRVVDGDTVILVLDGRDTKVRLIGVDTPETVHPQKPVEAYGKETSRFLKNLIEGESVYLEYEVGSSKVDKFGRTLAYLYRAPDRLFVNLEIIRQGYGHAYTKFPFRHMESFRAHERAAREAGKGLWGRGATIISDAEPAEAPTAGPTEARRSAPVSPPASVRPPTPVAGRSRELTVYVTRTGEKYHRDGCRYLSRSQIPMSLKDAKLSYSACSVCRPPQ